MYIDLLADEAFRRFAAAPESLRDAFQDHEIVDKWTIGGRACRLHERSAAASANGPCGSRRPFRPWFSNVSRSLRKEPKWYLRDWANVPHPGPRAETFVACHLAKAVDGWNDLGLGAFELGYIRDKERREVDFVVTRSGKPWFLAEVKYRDEPMSSHLPYYQDRLDVPFAFQVTLDAEYVDADCFVEPGRARVVPARTLLSQLL